MPVDRYDETDHPALVDITKALSELWAKPLTQAEVAQTLTDHGMRTDQTKVSAWLRGRIPTAEQLVQIEDAFDVPRGWILYRAGFIDLPGLVAGEAALRRRQAAARAPATSHAGRRRPAARPRPGS